ncbi:MAG: site-2 protease family protein [Acidobacteriota bacterium]
MEAIFDGLFVLLSFAVIVGAVVLVHELGHYLAARWVGVRVDVVSVGFGRRLFGWRRGHTDHRVSLIPLGGYVKLHGDGIVEPATGAPDELASCTPLEKMLIFGAGPAASLALAPVLLTCVAWIGVETNATAGLVRAGPLEAVEVGLTQTAQASAFIVDALGQVVTGRESMHSLDGPLVMAREAARAAQGGLVPTLQLMAILSLNLGLLNLLPIPVLDGGRMLLAALELVRGRDLSPRRLEQTYLAGFVVIVLLMVTVVSLDVIESLGLTDAATVSVLGLT